MNEIETVDSCLSCPVNTTASLFGLSPEYFNIFQYIPRQLRSSITLFVSKTKLNVGTVLSLSMAPLTIWNELPINLRIIRNYGFLLKLHFHLNSLVVPDSNDGFCPVYDIMRNDYGLIHLRALVTAEDIGVIEAVLLLFLCWRIQAKIIINILRNKCKLFLKHFLEICNVNTALKKECFTAEYLKSSQKGNIYRRTNCVHWL